MNVEAQRSGRILALLELVDEGAMVDDLREYLEDQDGEVRRTALSVLSEAAEDWSEASPVFAAALCDTDADVRRRAADLLGELSEVLVPSEPFAASLRDGVRHPDPTVRVAAIGASWRHRLATTEELVAQLADAAELVRCEVILGLVSLDALEALDTCITDPSSRVRIAAARGVAAVGDPRGITTLITLADDPETLVRAAALSGMAHTGCTDRGATVAAAALTDSAWQVRQAAATALTVAAPAEGVAPLVAATTDVNLDVRKAAVRALAGRLPGRPEVRAALEAARLDIDADVRAFARMGLAETEDALPPGPHNHPEGDY